MLTRPRWLLQTEAACYLALGLVLYRAGHFPWRLFLALFLAPDAGLWTEVPHKFPRYPPAARLIGEASSRGRSCGSGLAPVQ